MTPALRHGVALLAACLLPAVAAPVALASTTATAPAQTVIAAGATAQLSGASIAGFPAGDTLLVSLSTTLGTLTLPSTSGLTLNGTGPFTGSSFSFTGDQADVNAALADLELTGTGTPGSASITISVSEVPGAASAFAYDAADGHYFEYVSDPGITWQQAETAATADSYDGEPGYLATIPDSATNQFVEAQLNGASNVWAGGHSTDDPSAPGGVAREWTWQGGPYAGQEFEQCTNLRGTCSTPTGYTDPLWTDWGSGQPDNSSGTPNPDGYESALEINYQGAGDWNDLGDDYNSVTHNQWGITVDGYVVEYGGQVDGGTFTGVTTATSSVLTANGPSSPTNVVADGGTSAGGQATVSWTPGADGGAPITAYTVTASPGGQTCTTTGATSCTVPGLTNATGYSFSVTATNAVASSAASVASTAVTVHALPGVPVISLPGAGAVTDVTQPTFSGTADAGATVALYLDGTLLGSTTASSSGIWSYTPSTPISPGVHSTDATATNSYGDVSAASPAHQLTIDTTPSGAPTITAGPAALTTATGATFSFTVAKAGATFQCSLDGARWQSCAAPDALTGLSVGAHTFAVRAIDPAGNVSAATSDSWTVYPPSGPSGLPQSTATAIAASVTSAGARTVSAGCRLNAGSISSCTVVLMHGATVIGTGRLAYAATGHTQAPLTLTLTAAGRRLLAASRRAIAVSVRTTTVPFGFPALRQVRHATLVRPRRIARSTVHFAGNSARLTGATRRTLRRLAPHLLGARSVVCVGNASSLGTDARDRQIARWRAQNVCRMLRRLGVTATVSTVSNGDRRPVATNATPFGRSFNRRVSVHVVY